MFENVINNTKFCSEAGDKIFPRIHAGQNCMFRRDVSLAATLKILLADRLPEDEEFGVSMTITDTEDVNSMINTVYLERTYNHLKYVFFDYASDKAIRNYQPDVEGLEEINLSGFFGSKNVVRIFVARDSKFSMIVTKTPPLCKFHLIQAVIPRAIPWFFEDKHLNDDEKEYLKSFTFTSYNAYISKLAFFEAKYDFDKFAIDAAFEKFFDNMYQAQKDNATREIAALTRDINNMYNRIADHYKQIEHNNMILLGSEKAKEKIAEDNRGVIDFVKNNKNIHIVGNNNERNRNTLSFVITGYFDIYDPDAYHTISRNRNSCFYTSFDGTRFSHDVFAVHNNRMKLFDALFGESPVLKLRCCAYYYIDYSSYSVGTASLYQYDMNIINSHLPNPHIDHFACIGQYERLISRAIGRNDMIAAISQCAASAKSINFSEGITVRHFIQDIVSSNNKIVELPDGTCVTPYEAFVWLNNKENGNG